LAHQDVRKFSGAHHWSGMLSYVCVLG
jgi:hypothetical protein